MPSQSSSASWNPALMPNTAEDTVASKMPTAVPSSPLLELESPIEFSVKAAAPVSNIENHEVAEEKEEEEEEEEEEHVNGSRPRSMEDNTKHPELANLRSALETSLSSPGGVEMEESSWGNGDSKSEDLDDEKADFPSEGPPHEGKHSSTMSFARTVSHDVSWGEDDELDSEWSFQRTNTDPFKLMEKSDRKNSFPSIPPTHLPGIQEPLPNGQLGDIMNHVEQEPKDLFSDDENDEAHFFTQQSGSIAADPLSPTQHGNYYENHPGRFGQAYGGDVLPHDEEDSQARYEEGVPLVSTAAGHNVENNPPNSNHLNFMDHEADEEHDFFSQVSKSGKAHREAPPPLERKSTHQVMNALNIQSGQQRDNILLEEEEDKENLANSQSYLDRATGHGIAASASTVASQVLRDPGSAIHNESGDKPVLETESDEDLAAKWKAALGGAELLKEDEDGFLPDDDDELVEKKELDPAALFGSDDEGFLEDDDHVAVPQQTSPPIPTPVSGPNGHAVGFDTLTGSAHAYANRPSSSSSTSRYLPSGLSTTTQPSGNPYAPSAPLLTDLSRSATTPSIATSYMAQANSNFLPQPTRPEVPKAQSFVDKAKGGYHSPYDLPADVIKPRKRTSMHQVTRPDAPTHGVPPPRTSSAYGHPPPSRGSNSSMSPPTSSHSMQGSLSTSTNQLPLPKTIRKSQSQSGFFEELPMTKPKLAPRHSSSLGSPIVSPYAHPNGAPPPGRSPYAPPLQQPPTQAPPPQPHGLVAPLRINPYALLPTAATATAPPAAVSRYSPAPPSLQHSQTAPPPVSQSRYSPAPPIARPSAPSYVSQFINAPPPPQILPHQPRTSSPLAHFERGLDGRSRSTHSERGNFDRRSSSSHEANLRPYHLPPTREVDETEHPTSPPQKPYGELQNHYAPLPISPRGLRRVSPPSSLSHEISSTQSSPSKRAPSNYVPQSSAQGPPPPFMSPKRAQTQSPSSGVTAPKPSEPHYRPASVEIPPSPRPTIAPKGYPSYGRPRGASQVSVNYVAPTDGREHDPMQRWKGAPIFAWGVGGTIMTSFPKDIPRYGINQSTPMMVRSPGQVKIRNIKDIDPLPDRLTSFPGPLKGKAKKKEVVTWLTAGIAILEQNASYLRTVAQLSHEDKRLEERILLWKILRVFVENDGILEGNAVVEKAVRDVLSPGADEAGSSNTSLYATGAELSGISNSSTTATKADPVDPAAVDQLRRYLLRGDREKAVWDAVDKRLWAHAMLISNTVSKELYKQVCQEFVQKEVKNIGDNTEPLAALYEIFAGNFEESIDELVPPSARAGFQMVSTSNTLGPSKDAMEGLDRWRETLGLILSNRSVDDSQALNALGKLLAGYGRAEAGHICFLFARSYAIFGGIDDPLSSFVLVGSDHLRQPYEFDREMEPILLSEVFEYAMAMSNPTNLFTSSPHLVIYKLQHAKILAEYGYRNKALEYCDTIGNSIYSATRKSPYHHPLLIAELEDLHKRLKSSPKDDKDSWISKPSIDKAKGSVWSTFNKFVAGDDTDEASTTPNSGSAGDIGPFARIAGGTPTISRSPSTTDLYGPYAMNGSAPASALKSNSRYAPNAAYTPGHESQTSSGTQPRTSLEGRSSNEFRPYEPQRQMSLTSDYRPSSQPTTQAPHPSFQTSSSYNPPSNFGAYANPPSVSKPSKAPETPTEQGFSNIYSSPQPMSTFEGYQPSSYVPSELSSRQPSSNYEPFTSTFEPQNSSAPPAANSSEENSSTSSEPPSYEGYQPYEPPTYQPVSMDDEPDSPIDRPKKKSFMDDDEDDIPALKGPPVGEKTKAEKDREVDEAFRKAAEADAQKAKEAAPAKKGWGLTGWFGGSKKESTDMGAQPNKPIRAKLGEASSFVYDPDLKRWINKKAGAETPESRTATPPPPRSGPPRMHDGPNSAHLTSAPRSSSMGPPRRHVSALSEPPARPGTSAGDSPMSNLGGLMPPGMNRSVSSESLGAPPSAPPSRPGTSMSNASSIDDLLGPPLPRKGGAKGGKRRGRGYVDLMGDKKGGA